MRRGRAWRIQMRGFGKHTMTDVYVLQNRMSLILSCGRKNEDTICIGRDMKKVKTMNHRRRVIDAKFSIGQRRRRFSFELDNLTCSLNPRVIFRGKGFEDPRIYNIQLVWILAAWCSRGRWRVHLKYTLLLGLEGRTSHVVLVLVCVSWTIELPPKTCTMWQVVPRWAEWSWLDWRVAMDRIREKKGFFHARGSLQEKSSS